MKLDIVISDSKHPLVALLRSWGKAAAGHRVRIVDRLAKLRGGDALVMVACHEIARPDVLARYRRSYVTHASNLPAGRGWSPVVWTVLNGGRILTLSLIEPSEPVDSGRIYAKFRASIAKTDIASEINAKLGALVMRALDFVIENPDRKPRKQKGIPSWYPRRSAEDSRLDPNLSIAAQFDLLRICDPVRYPAFFDLHGQRFEILIRKSVAGNVSKR